MKSYVSIHDVSPQNLKYIPKIIETLRYQFKIKKFCILVIPGLNWNNTQIETLKSWQNSGIQIAAHGWRHKAKDKKSLYHKIHSMIISANCAEHLSKDKQEIIQIITDSFNWFVDNGLKKPILYVPPAWALGKITKEDLNQLSFTLYECTTGMFYKEKYCFLPLLGFEEKTFCGSIIRQFFNALNFILAKFTGIIRIAIHPNDFNLYLKKDLERYLYKCRELVLLHELR